jgi:Ca2+-binding EF-hand superfamily protein
MFKKIDTNHNGKLEFKEALQILTLLGKAGHSSK